MFDLFVSHVPPVDMSLIRFSQESGSRRLTRNSYLFFVIAKPCGSPTHCGSGHGLNSRTESTSTFIAMACT